MYNVNFRPHDSVMKEKAAALGERISSVRFSYILFRVLVSDLFSKKKENGVHTAIHSIYTYLDRASQDRASL
jgi:sterol 3beta-glucosyltransferase